MRRPRPETSLLAFVLAIATASSGAPALGGSLTAAAATKAPGYLRLAGAGAGYSGLRMTWPWTSGSKRFELQSSTRKSFSAGVSHRLVTSPARRPSGGTVSATALDLHQATVYYLRVRVQTKSGWSGWSTTAKASTKIGQPAAMSGVTAEPGPKTGEVTVRWTSTGRSTTGYQLDTALSTFSRTDPKLPDTGRHGQVFTVGAARRSLTLDAAQVAAAGAPVGSGYHLFVRLSAHNRGSAGSKVTYSPQLLAVSPKAPAVSGTGAQLTVGSFNVRTAKDSADHPWNSRAEAVAAQIVDRRLGVVGLQELSPVRADGRDEPVDGSPRQTDSLLAALHGRSGGAGYRLVREGAYAPATATLGQGARIAYDSARYRLLSSCPETSTGQSWSAACTIKLPLLAGENETYRRSAAYARFEDRQSGTRFWVASVHLDPRIGGSTAQQTAFDQLRATQIAAVTTTLARLDTAHEPVVLTGDINSWQGRPAGSRPNDALYRAGYRDAVQGSTATDLAYSTFNDWQAHPAKDHLGYGSRVDVIWTLGARGSRSYTNVVDEGVVPCSDHNLQMATIML